MNTILEQTQARFDSLTKELQQPNLSEKRFKQINKQRSKIIDFARKHDMNIRFQAR